MRSDRRIGLVVTGVALAVVTSGCGGNARVSAPSGVRTALAQVNAAVRAHEYQRARTALDLLVSRTTSAREHQQIDTNQAARVLAAAAQLQADLPHPLPPVVQTPSPPPAPTNGPKGDKHKGHGGDGNGDGDGQGNGNGPGGGGGD